MYIVSVARGLHCSSEESKGDQISTVVWLGQYSGNADANLIQIADVSAEWLSHFNCLHAPYMRIYSILYSGAMVHLGRELQG